MSVEAAFFQDIREHPDDDTPRLVYADWLMEQPDAALAARGEFIRLQCLLDRLPASDGQRRWLTHRRRELQETYERAWLGPLAEVAWDWEFCRGLVRLYVEGTAAGRLAGVPGADAWRWVDGLSVRAAPAGPLLELLRSPAAAALTTLELSEVFLERGEAEALASSPHLGRLAHLRAAGVGKEGRAALRARFGATVHF